MSDQANQFRDFSRYSTIHNNSHVDDESPQDSTSAATFQALQAVNPESRIQKLARKFTNIGLFNSLYKLKYYRYIVLACCFILSGFSSGTIHTWGIQQEYMVNTMFKNADKKTMMMLDWIGTLQFFFSLFSGIFAGILIKKISVRYTGLVGTTSIALGQILASFSHKPWQFCLCQSILVGAGCCTIYIPGVTTPALFFSGKRAGLVTGIAVAGGGAGGLIMAPITEKLLSIPSLALPGMLRITAIYTFVICGVSSILLSRPDSTQAEDKDEKANSPAPTVFSREITLVESGSLGGDASLSQIKGNVLETPKSNNLNREPETKKSIEWSLLKTPYRLAYCFSTFSVIAGYIIPYSYLPTYAVQYGLTPQKSSILIALMNAASGIGRLIMGVVADHFGILNTFVAVNTVCAVCIFAIWPFATSFGLEIVFGLIYGIASGGFWTLLTMATSKLFGAEVLSQWNGVIFTVSSFAVFLGGPVAGALLKQTAASSGDQNYLPLIMYSGSYLALGTLLIFTSRILYRRNLFAKE